MTAARGGGGGARGVDGGGATAVGWGSTVGVRFLAARGRYALNDVQGWGWGEVRGGLTWGWGGGVGDGIEPLRTTLHTISISLQNSFCETHTW